MAGKSMELKIRFNHLSQVSGGMDRLVNDALTQIGNDVRDEAKPRAPVDTGYLRDQIVVSQTGNPTIVHAGAPYSAFPEFGTRFMSAHPYLRPAFAIIEPHIPSYFGGIEDLA